MITYFKPYAKEFPVYMRALKLANLGISAVI